MDEHSQPPQPQPEKDKGSIRDRMQKTAVDLRLFERVLPSAFLIGVLSVLVYYVLFAPPTTFQTPAIVKVTPDETLDTIAIKLQDSDAIRNADTFKIVTRLLGGNRHIQSGSYFFPEPQNMFQIALRLIEGDYELHAVRITIAEGMTARDIGDMLVHKIAPFDEEQFLALAMPKEGRLYPDTYFFYPAQEPIVVIDSMENNLNQHLADATTSALITKSKRPLSDILNMASILVGEAATDHDRRVVAGILWKRISIGMPLQVDAPFGYIMDKSLVNLTHEDLTTDSPYNTYRNKGLPPTPIGNADIGAIRDAATPIQTKYLYYMSDRTGVMHFSTTYAQHLRNIAMYLK